MSVPSVTTQYVDWFEFTAIGSWDSALLDHNGVARPSYCALTGYPQGNCPGSTLSYHTPGTHAAAGPAGSSPTAGTTTSVTPEGAAGSSMINGTVAATPLSQAAAAHTLAQPSQAAMPPSRSVNMPTFSFSGTSQQRAALQASAQAVQAKFTSAVIAGG